MRQQDARNKEAGGKGDYQDQRLHRTHRPWHRACALSGEVRRHAVSLVLLATYRTETCEV